MEGVNNTDSLYQVWPSTRLTRKNPKAVVQRTTPTEERSEPTKILKKNFTNACTFEQTLATSAGYRTANTDLNTRPNGCVQSSAVDFRLGHGTSRPWRCKATKAKENPFQHRT